MRFGEIIKVEGGTYGLMLDGPVSVCFILAEAEDPKELVFFLPSQEKSEMFVFLSQRLVTISLYPGAERWVFRYLEVNHHSDCH